ncbi:MAG: methyltransferase domain-containing protein [Dehalococcoidia bacterium]|nr:methyltransferase domain-containing protein [Dehalococcoidia bacterium]MCB9484939.1 methyltransferase domain-containing protein [Thermoflexaceae bacterium]
MAYTLEQLGERYGAWWIDALGEHNHIGGLDSTRWLLDRAGLRPGDRMLDSGAFVGAAARHAATSIPGLRVVATDMNPEFLQAGREMEGGHAVDWVTAATERLPFASASFQSVWALDTAMPPRELARVAAPRATLCLCCEAPNDNRGGAEAFFEEWEEYGWRLSAHRALSLEATNTWRKAEADVVWRHTFYEERYGKRGYGGQLDLLTSLVQMYERGEAGHGLYVFSRG